MEKNTGIVPELPGAPQQETMGAGNSKHEIEEFVGETAGSQGGARASKRERVVKLRRGRGTADV
jgi:hypothetical protein